MSETKILPPNPSRLIEGLRDTGYDFNMALADIIDNSVDANASLVDIHIDMDLEGSVAVYVADNGSGMDRERLENAMTYGSKSNKGPHSLGKFGLGLKTASTAFCRRLSVLSRPSKGEPILKAIWDLDHVVHANQWELLFEEPLPEEVAILEDVTHGGSGTLVKWEKVDRLIHKYENPSSVYARRAMRKIVEDFQHHAGMVFQCFLDASDSRARTIEMTLNDEKIVPWDPFCRTEKETEIVAEEHVKVQTPEGKEAEFTVKAYILPRKEQFSTPETATLARLSNANQGLYIYRENRLIHAADWLGMLSKEPHFTLLRVEFSFDHVLDSAFNVDIKKSRILINEDLYNWLLDKFLPAPRNAANERYRQGVKKKKEETIVGAHDGSNVSIGGMESDLVISSVGVKNKEKNEVEIINKLGRFVIKIPITKASKEGEVVVQPVPGIDDGLLWEPCLIDTHHAVRINTGHPYYEKVYVPNLGSGVTIQGMDSLLWAISEAELGTINEAT
ncbi:MAG: ATP-binding protein, partial [Candidatus Tectomicrobia bacterium]|nr:ATP-binding protein [Candidatus Tectomicrobia bacterium]